MVRRFDELEVSHGEVFVRDGPLTVRFEDPEGQRLAQVAGAWKLGSLSFTGLLTPL